MPILAALPAAKAVLLLSLLSTCVFNLAANAAEFDTTQTSAQQTNDFIQPKNIPSNKTATNKSPMLVIVMDDLGNNLERGIRAVELPGALTYGILPHTPLAKKLAFYVSQFGNDKEVIIHMPMEASSHKHLLGPGALEMNHNQQLFVDTLQHALSAIPFAKGLSNHMGSRLTSLPDRMDWLMSELSKSDFYFLDSKTTGNSAAMSAAAKQSIPYLARDIFLDHDPDPLAIDLAFNKALTLAKHSGLAVIIAHPYPSTLDFLEVELPKLAQSGVSLVNASQAIKQQELVRSSISPLSAPALSTSALQIALKPAP